MIYRLKPSYMLRGWDKMAWALVRRPENEVRKLSKEMFQTLLFCDGETDLTDELRKDLSEAALTQCEEQGIIEVCDCARPLEPDQYYKYFHNRYVQSVFWSVTGRCNFRCRHCYMDAPDAMLGELSTEEALELLDQMADCGVMHLDLTGGEPLVRRDFWQLIDRIQKHKMVIGKVYTNGWLLDESVLDEFEKRQLRPKISISFDGVGWHDWMRGIPGAEKAALRALRLCRERGFDTDVEMCIHRGNQETLMETIQALLQVGVTELKTSNIAMTDLWCSHSEGNALTQPEYIEAMLKYIPKYYEAGRPLELTLAGVISLHRDGSYEIHPEHYDGTEKCLNCYLCRTARWFCYITPDGRLLPCLPMTASPEQSRFPKVQDIGLRQGLSDSLYMRFVNTKVKDLLEVNEECGTCPYRFKCGGGCRAEALRDGRNDLMGCDRIMCMYWKGGYAERIRQVAEETAARYL